MSNISLEQPAVSWKLFFLTALGIAVIAGSAVGIASYANSSRTSAVIQKYTTEAQGFIQQNQKEIDSIFTATMDECDKQLQAEKKAHADSYQVSFQCENAKNSLVALNKNGFSNFSSTAILKYSPKKGYEFISMDGTYTQSTNLDVLSQLNWGDPKTDLQSYIMSNKQVKLWNDYIQYMTGKEVLVRIPSTDDSVRIMFRGVIE